jgi:unsaturated rhamnogalacturonyl hydrolase
MGKLTGDKKYYDDAVKQILQFSARMFNREKGLFMHGWILHMEVHPEFYWARANGWAVMAMVELLDVLPEDHPQRSNVLSIFKEHIKGLAQCQSGYGLWHQLLDRSDSYLETSASAMYTFSIAKAINNKWIDQTTYGPMVLAGWNALTTRINDRGQVSGTCVGTGMGFEPIFYYYRPNSEYAAHGYGPVFLAGSEVIKLIRNYQPKLNPMIEFPKN